MFSSGPRALVVDDDNSWQQIISEILSDAGLEVDLAISPEEAFRALKKYPHRLAIVDLSLSANDHNNTDGLRVLNAIHQHDPNCRAILLTGFATVELAVAALTDYGVYTFLRKENFSRGQFQELIRRSMASPPIAVPSNTSLSIQNEIPIHIFTKDQLKSANRKALIVEDDAGWRSIFEELLSDSGFQVRACSSFGEALAYLRREKFTISVVDLSLSGSVSNYWDRNDGSENLDGLQVLASTRIAGIPTIIVSGVASPEEIKRTYTEQSIFAFLEKQTFDRTTFKRIIEEARIASRQANEFSTLTEREHEVLELVSKGLTNKEIANRLIITSNTVKRHLKAIFEKIGVHTRAAAAAKALSENN
jgi:DNA-binding NarL/FixJ family response regulator